MPLDSVTLSALAAELRERLTGAKIDKVQQPERKTVLLTLRCQTGNFRLALCGGAGNARVHLTDAAYENPAQPPMFCMLLRKHLVGARIAAIEQPERERILILNLDAFDEMGTPVKKQLSVEMIGHATNIVLVDGEGRIIDCMRRVDGEMNAARQLLPGLIYRLPERQDKPDFFSLTAQERRSIWAEYRPDQTPESWLLARFASLSPLLCRELVFRCRGDLSTMPDAMEALAETVAAGDFVPYMLLQNGKPKDVTFLPILQYGAAMEGERYPDFSALLDAFYTRRSQAEEMRLQTAALRRSVKTAHDRVTRKLALQTEELEKTAQREEKRRRADLLTANLYRAPKGGLDSITLEDFYEPDGRSVTIPLDPLKSLQENAAAYYKAYRKEKTAEQYLTRLIGENRREEEYLSSVLDELDRAASAADVAEIRSELTQTGYLRVPKNRKKEMFRKSSPLRYRSSQGMEILVGRSNVQNDELTTKLAHKGDLWLHVQKIHGSHVIVRCLGAEVDPQTLSEAASLAAYHSQASGGGKVAVDYTRVKYVKKPSGARPGMVNYTDYATVAAEADASLAQRLRA